MLYVHKNALKSYFAFNLERMGINFNVVDDLKSVSDCKSNIVLKPMSENFCRVCPATKNYNCCNYYNTDSVEGCPYDCSYCILQGYLKHKSVYISSNIDSMIGNLQKLIAAGKKLRIGTGELSDSLALDHLFPFTRIISPIINKQNILQFEYKTKSVNINNLLDLNPRNIVVSWSLNSESVIENEEFGAATFEKRLNAAKICAEYGYKIGFHFDPVIQYEGCVDEYKSAIKRLVNTVPEESVEYISFSTFRAPSGLIDAIRLRSKYTNILKGDFIHGADDKVRYYRPLRTYLLKKLISHLKKYWKNVFVYLCMENKYVWETVLGFVPGEREEIEKLFNWYK